MKQEIFQKVSCMYIRPETSLMCFCTKCIKGMRIRVVMSI
jgi:hypothetical protein